MTENKAEQQWQLIAITEALGDLKIDIEDNLSIGRGKENDLVLASKRVSRQHVSFAILADRLFIKDLGSSNGTTLNEVPLEANKPKSISSEDVINIAGFEFTVVFAKAEIEEDSNTSSDKSTTDDLEATEADIVEEYASSTVDSDESTDQKGETAEALNEHSAEDMKDINNETQNEQQTSQEESGEEASSEESKDSQASDTLLDPDIEEKENLTEPLASEEDDSTNKQKTVEVKKDSEDEQAEQVDNQTEVIAENLEESSKENLNKIETKDDVDVKEREIASANVNVTETIDKQRVESPSDSTKVKHVEAPPPPIDPNASPNWTMWIMIAIAIGFIALMIV